MGGSIPLARTTLLATPSNGEVPVTPPMQKTRNPLARFFIVQSSSKQRGGDPLFPVLTFMPRSPLPTSNFLLLTESPHPL